nr:DUF3095 family protein [Planctomycetota bacterium]
MESVDIPVIEDFADIAALDRYVEIPDDWWVAAADVQGSTTAIRAGRYKDVNLLGVSTIAAVVNALKPLRVPFVFGGDGATFCVPGSAVGAVRAALASVRALGRESFDLELRIGVVPVSAVRAAGKRVLVAYFRSSPTYLQAVFAGGGMSWAERVLKDEARSGRYAIPGDTATAAGADCGGLECRWSEIVSPHGETVALLVQATGYDDASESETYRAAIAAIDAAYGDARRSHPVSADRLRLGPASALGGEQAVRTHRRGLGAR